MPELFSHWEFNYFSVASIQKLGWHTILIQLHQHDSLWPHPSFGRMLSQFLWVLEAPLHAGCDTQTPISKAAELLFPWQYTTPRISRQPWPNQAAKTPDKYWERKFLGSQNIWTSAHAKKKSNGWGKTEGWDQQPVQSTAQIHWTSGLTQTSSHLCKQSTVHTRYCMLPPALLRRAFCCKLLWNLLPLSGNPYRAKGRAGCPFFLSSSGSPVFPQFS